MNKTEKEILIQMKKMAELNAHSWETLKQLFAALFFCQMLVCIVIIFLVVK